MVVCRTVGWLWIVAGVWCASANGTAAAQSVTARLRTVAPAVDWDSPPPPKPARPLAPAAAPAPAPAPATAGTKPTAAAPTATKPTAAAPGKASASGTAPPSAEAKEKAPTAVPAAGTSAAPAGAPAAPQVVVKGLTGTLNKDDVHQTMEAQQPAFKACIEQHRRSVRWVSGTMRFAFKVDGAGRVLDARPVQSDVGHRELEQCLTSAVSAVVFPKPAGRARAQFAWTVLVDPAGTPPDPLDAKPLASMLRRQRRAIARSCALRPRERFALTAYVGAGGKVLNAGGFALRRGAEKVDCVVEAVGELRLPKVTRRSKVSFKF